MKFKKFLGTWSLSNRTVYNWTRINKEVRVKVYVE